MARWIGGGGSGGVSDCSSRSVSSTATGRTSALMATRSLLRDSGSGGVAGRSPGTETTQVQPGSCGQQPGAFEDSLSSLWVLPWQLGAGTDSWHGHPESS